MDLGNAFGWAFKDPNWFVKFLLIGLIGLIPIVGWINLIGWMLTCADYRRQGYQVLPEAGFQHLGRGINLFVVALVYVVVFYVIFFVIFGVLLAGAGLAANGGSAAGAALLFGSAGFSLVFPLIFLAFYALYPTLIVATEHGGIGGGLNLPGVVRLFLTKPGPALLSALMFLVAGFIGGLGIWACCVGILITLPYSYTIMGATLAELEREMGVRPPPTTTMPPPPPAYPPVAPA